MAQPTTGTMAPTMYEAVMVRLLTVPTLGEVSADEEFAIREPHFGQKFAWSASSAPHDEQNMVTLLHKLPRPYDLPCVQIRKSDDLDNACAKSRVLEALLAQAVAMQIISTSEFRGWRVNGNQLLLTAIFDWKNWAWKNRAVSQSLETIC